MKSKAKIFNIAVCVLAFVIMLVYMLTGDEEGFAAALSSLRFRYLALAALVMIAYWLFEALSLHAVARTIDKSHKFRHSLIVTIIGQYYNCITPSATGGQPMQTIYLMRFGADFSTAITALLSRFIVYQFMLTLYCFVMLLVRFDRFSTDFAAMKILTLIGFLVNLAVIMFLIILAFFGNLAAKIVDSVLKLLKKLHLIKDLTGKREHFRQEMEQYRQNFAFLRKKPLLILRICGYTFLQLTCYFSISFVIYKGYGLSGTDFLTILAAQSFVLMITSFVPLPGAAGASEGGYGAFFGGIFGPVTTFTTFVWRLLTFYLPIVVGLITTLLVDHVTINKNEVKKPE